MSSVLIPLSQAIDLAEGRSPGHAQRVAFIALRLAETLGLDQDAQLNACYAGLLHDLGVVGAGADIAGSTRGDERAVFSALPLLTPREALASAGESSDEYVERVAGHVTHGVRAAQILEMSEPVARAIGAHHERWDGEGYPDSLLGPEIPLLGRVLSLADHIEALIDQTSPLLARRNFAHWMLEMSGVEGDPDVVSSLMYLGAGDSFWLGLYSGDLAAELSSRCAGLREPVGPNILPLAENFARLVDARFSFTDNISNRVAHYAEMLGKVAGLSDLTIRKLRVASLLHDIGQLSIPERILSKPGILSVEEMDALHLHPMHSRDVVSAIPSLEDVAIWVESHHERIDGRGYPDGKQGDEIPLEARILAIADAYVAITSDRPHRPRVEGNEARERLRQAAGGQLDADLVELFLGKVLGDSAA